MNILFFGDVMGKPGRKILREKLPVLKERFAADLVIANGENASGGVGLSSDTMRELFAMGVDVLTSGNHIWKHKEMYNTLEKEERIVRPANYPEGTPGRGMTMVEVGEHKVAILNLLGRTFLEDVDCPFRGVKKLLAELPEDVTIKFVDFHAETTSEKKAMGWYLDGEISALVGTHTHVQTADATIMPQGTAYITDAGMCGVEGSCLGMDPNIIIDRFLTRLPKRFHLAKGPLSVNGIAITIDEETGKATEVTPIRE